MKRESLPWLALAKARVAGFDLRVTLRKKQGPVVIYSRQAYGSNASLVIDLDHLHFRVAQCYRQRGT